MLTDDTDELIRQYYAWSSTQDPADIGYPHSDAVRRLRGGSVRSLLISDEEAEHVNRALCRLQEDAPDVYLIVRKHYRDRRTILWMEKRGMGGRKRLAKMLAEGRQFVRGYMCAAVA